MGYDERASKLCPAPWLLFLHDSIHVCLYADRPLLRRLRFVHWTACAVHQNRQLSQRIAAYVKGRDNFRRNGQSANIGKYAFGFEWAALACFFLSTILFCIGGGARRDNTSTKRRGFGGKRSRSTRSRGSFVHDKEYGA